jgi:hypothetical protein
LDGRAHDLGLEKPQAGLAYCFEQAQDPENMSFDYYELMDAEQSREVEHFKIIQSFASNLLDNIKDLDPEFSKVIDEQFWDLV